MSAAEQLDRIWKEAWRPPDRQPVWQWAEQHVRSIPYSPMPGRFRVANSPMIQEVMEAIVAQLRTCLINFFTMSGVSCGDVRRITVQPSKVAVRYFSASAIKPLGEVWRPRHQTPPSISKIVRLGMCAKSAFHRRVGWKRYSCSNSGPSWSCQSCKKRFSRGELMRSNRSYLYATGGILRL